MFPPPLILHGGNGTVFGIVFGIVLGKSFPPGGGSNIVITSLVSITLLVLAVSSVRVCDSSASLVDTITSFVCTLKLKQLNLADAEDTISSI